MAQNLRESYDNIASEYHQKKSQPWRDFLRFLEIVGLNTSDVVIDVGAGNGRNLHGIRASLSVALDLSTGLLRGYVGPELSQRVAGAFPSLPFRTGTADTLLCIAVIHHLKTEEEVINALTELRRVGSEPRCILSVWRRWRKGYREKLLERIRLGADINDLINHNRPWYNSNREVLATRFYHYYSFRELHHRLLLSGFRIEKSQYLGGKTDDANIFVEAVPFVED